MSETETTVVESSKPSKLAAVRSAALTAGIFVVPSAVMIGASYFGYKTSVNNVDAARLTLEAAKIAAQKA